MTALQRLRAWLAGGRDIRIDRPGWDPGGGTETVNRVQRDLANQNSDGSLNQHMLQNSLAVNQARLREYQKFTAQERELVSLNFPVVYGARVERNGVMQLAPSDIRGEVAVRNGITRSEMRVIFVPKERISLVRQLLAANLGPDNHIEVEDIATFR